MSRLWEKLIAQRPDWQRAVLTAFIVVPAAVGFGFYFLATGDVGFATALFVLGGFVAAVGALAFAVRASRPWLFPAASHAAGGLAFLALGIFMWVNGQGSFALLFLLIGILSLVWGVFEYSRTNRSRELRDS